MLMDYFPLYLKNAGVVLMTNNFISDGREGKSGGSQTYREFSGSYLQTP